MGQLLLPDFVGRYSKYHSSLGIRGYIQTDGYSCGYAAAATLLMHFGLGGLTGSSRALWRDLAPSPDDGVTTGNLLKAVRKRGLVMTKIAVNTRSLRGAFDQGCPVLVCSRLDHQPTGEEHWMVAAGMDDTDVLLLNQPSWTSPRTWWPLRKLVRRASEPSGWVARPK